MKSKLMRMFLLVMVVVMLASSLGACAPAAAAKVKIKNSLEIFFHDPFGLPLVRLPFSAG